MDDVDNDKAETMMMMMMWGEQRECVFVVLGDGSNGFLRKCSRLFMPMFELSACKHQRTIIYKKNRGNISAQLKKKVDIIMSSFNHSRRKKNLKKKLGLNRISPTNNGLLALKFNEFCSKMEIL